MKRPYFILNADDWLNNAAALMGKHILQGLEAPVTIVELQSCFQSYYRRTTDND